MTHHFRQLVAALVVLAGVVAPAAGAESRVTAGPQRPPLPVALRGQSFGFTGGCLIAVGGVNEQGRATADAFVLPISSTGTSATWQPAKSPSPLAWAATASIGDAFICCGGLDERGPSARVIRFRWSGGQLQAQRLPDMPTQRRFAGAAVVRNVLYVTGGVRAIASSSAEPDLLALDLADPSPHWQTLPPCPGPERILPTVVAQYEVLHVFGGREIVPAGDGKPTYRALTDAWIYRPRPIDGTTRRGWIRIADLPQALASAAGFASGQAHVILVGGDTRAVIATPTDLSDISAARQRHVLAYHSVTDSWADLGEAPLVPVSPTAITAQKQTYLLGGVKPEGSCATTVTGLSINPIIKGLHALDYAVIVAYFAGMVAIGIYFSRRQTSSTEFALGGRRTKWWVVAISLYATGTSAISFMAIPALAYATNLVFLMISLAAGLMIIPQAYLAIPLIRRLELTSTYEYLERRFNPSLRLLASAQCIIFQIAGRMCIVLLLPALAISSVTGLNVLYSVLIMGVLTTFYTAIGGIDAVMWTDVVQAGLMFGAPLLAIGIIMFSLAGGPAELIHTNLQYSKFNFALLGWDWTMPVIWIFLLDGLTRVAGFAGDQTMVQRTLCTPSVKQARNATIWAWIIGMASAVIFQFMGIAFFAYFHAKPQLLDPTMRNDQVLPLFIVQSLPIGVAGLIIAGLFAASMSALSGTMNSVATLLVEDFYRRIRPDAPDCVRLKLMKRLSYVVGAIGTALALVMAGFQLRSIFETWNNIIALLGGGFLGIYTLGMFSTRASAPGAITGALASILITAAVKAFTPLHWTLYTPIAILSCILIGYAASLLMPGARKNLSELTIYAVRPPQRQPVRETLVPAAAV